MVVGDREKGLKMKYIFEEEFTGFGDVWMLGVGKEKEGINDDF